MPADEKHVQELETEVERLKKLVHQDTLTGLLNRAGLCEHTEALVKRYLFTLKNPNRRRIAFRIEGISVLFLDFDDFKEINDAQGHDAGDDALKAVSKILADTVRDSDFVSRWSGDEFVVVLLGASEDEAGRIAEKIKEKLNAVNLSMSIGVAELVPDVAGFDELVTRADKAMYAAKRERGKNAIVRYSELT